MEISETHLKVLTDRVGDALRGATIDGLKQALEILGRPEIKSIPTARAVIAALITSMESGTD